MKKYFLIILLILFVGIIIFLIFTRIPIKTLKKPNYQTLQVLLGEEFILHENQTAIIESEDIEIKIVKFYNLPCPKNASCFFASPYIEFETNYKGDIKRAYNNIGLKFLGYQTIIIDSDYKTYAKLQINKMKEFVKLIIHDSTPKSLTVYEEGVIVFSQEEEKSLNTVSSKEITSLKEYILNSNFFLLQEKYEKSMVLDSIAHTITTTIGEKTHTVYCYCDDDCPANFNALVEKIKSLWPHNIEYFGFS